MKTVLIVVAVMIALPILKQLVVFALARMIGRAVGQAALNQQPDQIQLRETDADAWNNARAAAVIAAPLLARGFASAGVFRIVEMPGVVVQLLAKPEDLRLIGAQMVGGEGIKERADFLAMCVRTGITLEQLATMENVYSPPIGALNEPIALAAQDALARLATR